MLVQTRQESLPKLECAGRLGAIRDWSRSQPKNHWSQFAFELANHHRRRFCLRSSIPGSLSTWAGEEDIYSTSLEFVGDQMTARDRWAALDQKKRRSRARFRGETRGGGGRHLL